MTWVYHISPASIETGRGRSSMIDLKGVATKTRKDFLHPLTKQKVNCAALCLAYYHVMNDEKYLSFKPDVTKNKTQHNVRLWQIAMDIQLSMGWADSVTIDQLMMYLTVHKDLRIVLYCHTAKQARYDVVGQDYIWDEQKNIVYIHYDVERKHFTYITHILACIKWRNGATSQQRTWCSKCSTCFTLGSPCNCEEPVIVINKRKKGCTKCGASLYFTSMKNHNCGYNTCQFCQLQVGEFADHRCPLYEIRSDEKYPPFVGEPGATKKSYNLIAYDFESCIGKK